MVRHAEWLSPPGLQRQRLLLYYSLALRSAYAAARSHVLAVQGHDLGIRDRRQDVFHRRRHGNEAFPNDGGARTCGHAALLQCLVSRKIVAG